MISREPAPRAAYMGLLAVGRVLGGAARGEPALRVPDEPAVALALAPAAGLAPGLARQPGLDVEPAHHDGAGDPQDRAARIRVAAGRAVVDAAHHRGDVAVDRELGRHDDLEPAHDAGDVELGDAGREVGVAEV